MGMEDEVEGVDLTIAAVLVPNVIGVSLFYYVSTQIQQSWYFETTSLYQL
jgi:hypothetical protein